MVDEALEDAARDELGRYDGFVAEYGKVRVRLDEVLESKPRRSGWDRASNLLLNLRGAEVLLERPASGGKVEISVSGNDVYSIEFRSGDRKVGEARIVQPVTPDGSLEVHVIEAPPDPFDVITVRPSAGDGRYSLGHVRLVPG